MIHSIFSETTWSKYCSGVLLHLLDIKMTHQLSFLIFKSFWLILRLRGILHVFDWIQSNGAAFTMPCNFFHYNKKPFKSLLLRIILKILVILLYTVSLMPGCESKLIVGNSLLEHPRVKRITLVTLGTSCSRKGCLCTQTSTGRWKKKGLLNSDLKLYKHFNSEKSFLEGKTTPQETFIFNVFNLVKWAARKVCHLYSKLSNIF